MRTIKHPISALVFVAIALLLAAWQATANRVPTGLALAAPWGVSAVALAFLGHFVVDLHMPLHASFADDKEGTAIDAIGLCETSLHWAWDNCIFEARVEPGKRSDDDIRRLAAAWIARTPAPAPSEPWKWANESYALARLPWLGYCTMLDDACQYASWLPAFAEGQPHRKVMFDERYLDNATPIVAERLTLAGLRLADLLNRALDPGYG